MDYVPDTSVIVDGRFTAFIEKQDEAKVILSEAMIAEVEHQSNEGRSIGFAALEELKTLRDLGEYCRILIEGAGKDEEELHKHPTSTPVGRIDEVRAARDQKLNWRS